jgi:hypothetical protein
VIDTGIDLITRSSARIWQRRSSRTPPYDFSGEDDADATDWNGHGRTSPASLVRPTPPYRPAGLQYVALKVFLMRWSPRGRYRRGARLGRRQPRS